MRALVELALYECREQPAEDLRTWDDRILQKIGRHDLRHLKKKAFTSESNSLAPTQGDTSAHYCHTWRVAAAALTR